MDFQTALKSKTLITDGAMGSYLWQQGFSSQICLEQLNLTQPQHIQKIHRDYLNAGAQILYSHTFGANPIRLKKHGLESQMTEINQRAIQNLRIVSQNQAYLAGNIGPSGLSVAQLQNMTQDDLAQNFAQQAQVLINEGVDALVLETFTTLKELQAALYGCQQVNSRQTPVLACMSLSSSAQLADTTSLQEAIAFLNTQSLAGIGINCINGPDQAIPALKSLKSFPCFPIVVKPNAGVPTLQNQQWVYPWQAKDFAEQMKTIILSGANIIGGCCGTTPEYIRELAKL